MNRLLLFLAIALLGVSVSAQESPVAAPALNGKAISLPKPLYPAIAKQAHASGSVIVHVTIEENGNVISARAISGHPLLQAVAVAAARRAKFSATIVLGQPAKATALITYNFDTNEVAATTATAQESMQKKAEQLGFREQKFEPSPLDELSKLVLTPSGSDQDQSSIADAKGGRVIDPVMNLGTLRKFPATYRGNDPNKVYSSLAAQRSHLVKSEFETTNAFRERLAKSLGTTKVSDGRTLADTFTFVTGAFDESYDADFAILTLNLSITHRRRFDYSIPKELIDSFYQPAQGTTRLTNGFVAIDLRSGSRTLGSAVGRNAFGVRVRYLIRTYATMHLAMRDTSFESSFGQKLLVKMAPAKARSLMGHIAIAFSGNLKFPFVFQETSIDKPTITDPEEVRSSDFYLFFEPRAHSNLA